MKMVKRKIGPESVGFSLEKWKMKRKARGPWSGKTCIA